ncbi:MAG TPA: orotate phosphoribosyltransferase [Fusobacterium sp.]|uniref:orotate phosphoribosyltransferase n=1 Tax=Fusobacterium sp. TaxID=68766 RepID=UPI002F414D19
MSRKEAIAQVLLSTGAVKLNVKEPFTFVSGIKSPIYCDNRQMIAYPKEREVIIRDFQEVLEGKEYDVLAGTATAGIPWAAFLAHSLQKPMSYIRGEKKNHGAGKQIEGANVKGKKVIVIEDLISTGGSSIKAVEAAYAEGATSVEVIAIFSYEFPKAYQQFGEKKIAWQSLSNFEVLIQKAEEMNYVSEEERKIAADWNQHVDTWGK